MWVYQYRIRCLYRFLYFMFILSIIWQNFFDTVFEKWVFQLIYKELFNIVTVFISLMDLLDIIIWNILFYYERWKSSNNWIRLISKTYIKWNSSTLICWYTPRMIMICNNRILIYLIFMFWNYACHLDLSKFFFGVTNDKILTCANFLIL